MTNLETSDDTTPTLEIEPASMKSSGRCGCCGNSRRTAWGFVYRDGGPHACYFIEWTLGRSDCAARFDVVVGQSGPRTLAVRFADIGFAAAPRMSVNGVAASGGAAPSTSEGWREATFKAPLKAGHNRIVLSNPDRPLDYDWLQIDPVASP